MKKIKLGLGFTMFIIFFGVAMLQSMRLFSLTEFIFWITIAFLFILADNTEGWEEDLEEKKID